MDITAWLNLSRVRHMADGTSWLVCGQCGVRMALIGDGYALADLLNLTRDHRHAQ